MCLIIPIIGRIHNRGKSVFEESTSIDSICAISKRKDKWLLSLLIFNSTFKRTLFSACALTFVLSWREISWLLCYQYCGRSLKAFCTFTILCHEQVGEVWYRLEHHLRFSMCDLILDDSNLSFYFTVLRLSGFNCLFSVFTWRHQILEFKTGRPTKFLPSFKERLPKNMSVHNFLARCRASFWK